MPYLLPAIIDPPSSVCIPIHVPNDRNHLAAFFGALRVLSIWDQWERDPANSGKLVADVWRDVIDQAISEIGECGLQIVSDVRIDENGVLEKLIDGEWLNAGDVAAMVSGSIQELPSGEAPTLVIAADDIEISLPASQQIQKPAFNPQVEDFSERACAIAHGLMDWIEAKYSDTIDAIEAGADMLSAFDLIFLSFPVVYVVVDQFFDALNEIVEATVNVARTWMTQEKADEMREKIYCLAINDGEFTADDWATFRAWIITQYPTHPARSAFSKFISSIRVDAILKRASFASYGSGNCAGYPCGADWEHIWDFATSDYGITPEAGNYVAGKGWEVEPYWRSDLEHWENDVRLRWDGLDVTTFTTYKMQMTEIDPQNLASVSFLGQSGDVPTEGSFTYIRQGFSTDDDRVLAVLRVDAAEEVEDLIGAGFVKNITIRGMGVDPF